jgi:hypothetical protein
MARVAGHLKKTISPNTVTIGKKARRAKIPKLINKTSERPASQTAYTRKAGYILSVSKFQVFIKQETPDVN